MKRLPMGIFFVFLFLMMMPTYAAEDLYVKGDLRVTFRTGPGNDHKIIKMLETGEKIEVLERSDDWARAKLEDNREGWIMERFLTSETPATLLLEGLRVRYKALNEKYQALSQNISGLRGEKQQLSSELKKTQKELAEAKTAFEELKKNSTEYLTLEANYENVSAQLAQQTERVNELRQSQNKEYMVWFMVGAGVLLLGLLIGSLLRRRPSYATSIRL